MGFTVSQGRLIDNELQNAVTESFWGWVGCVVWPEKQEQSTVFREQPQPGSSR